MSNPDANTATTAKTPDLDSTNPQKVVSSNSQSVAKKTRLSEVEVDMAAVTEPSEIVFQNLTTEIIILRHVNVADKPADKIELQPHRFHKVKIDDFKNWSYDENITSEQLKISLVKPQSVTVIANNTACRIEIPPKKDASSTVLQGQPLVISGFGSRTIETMVAAKYNLDPLKGKNYITVTKDPVVAQESRSDIPMMLVGFSFLSALLWPVLLLVPDQWIKDTLFSSALNHYWIIPVGLLVLAPIAHLFLREKGKRISTLYRYVNLLIVLMSAFAVPYLIAYANAKTGSPNVTPFNFPVVPGPAVVLWISFVAILSVLPALLFYQYMRRQATTLREQYIKDIMMLNPKIETKDDANLMYGPSINEASGLAGGNSQYLVFGNGRPVLLTTVILALGWSLTLPVPNSTADLSFDLLNPNSHPVAYAFLGSYYFGLTLLFRRYARSDLSPKAYDHVLVRTICAIIGIWVVSKIPLVLPLADKTSPQWLIPIAFGIGIFPESGLAFIADHLRLGLAKINFSFPSLQDKHPLTDLEGVSLYDRVRLQEEGIHNVENLAHGNLMDLLLTSGIPTPRLVDLVDQAILRLHVTGYSNDQTKREKEIKLLDELREQGVRTATDLYFVNERERERALPEGKDPAEQHPLAKLFRGTESHAHGIAKLDNLIASMKDDEWMNCLIHWRQLTMQSVPKPGDGTKQQDGENRTINETGN